MRDIYFGDRRDRVKWGVLVHIAQSHGLHSILQVAYSRNLGSRTLQTPDGPVELDGEVWRFFSSLDRVVDLGARLGLAIRVVDAPFANASRSRYVDLVLDELVHVARPALVFLDPDTGLSDRPAAEHTARGDVECVWAAMQRGEWLVVYQHADHTGTWLERRKALLTQWCGGVEVQVFTGHSMARDVAFLAVER